MAIRNLKIYASYFDTKEFSVWLAEHGADGLSETSGNIETGSAANIRLGGVMRSVREHHADRLAETNMELIKFTYHSALETPDIPERTYWVGILYLEDPKVGDIEVMPLDDLAYSGSGMVLTAFWKKLD